MLGSLLLASQAALGGSPAALVAFPMDPAGEDAATRVPVLAPRADEFAALTAIDSAVLVGVPLPRGSVDLELERVAIEDLGFGIRVDGAPAPGVLDGLDLSVWLGRVPGEPGSEAMVSFSRVGVRGWVKTHGEMWHLMPQPSAAGDWSDSRTFVVAESRLVELGLEDQRRCGLDELGGVVPEALPSGAIGGELGGCEGFVLPLAVETDFQLFQVFGDLQATAAYTVALLGAASGRYEEQIDTTLTYPYLQFYTDSNDPWSTPESGGSMLDMLDEFESAWAGNVPGGGQLGLFLSGAPLGGGVAYIGVLCEDTQSFTFAVCGNIDGQLPFPVQSGPTTWDFIVLTHELGHNFNSPHTHDYSPPIDNCADGSGCIPDGTIMSYCHQCPGGLDNMTTYFHPTVVNVMKSHASACLDSLVPLSASGQPTLVAPGFPTTVSVDVIGTPVGDIELHYRFDDGPYQVLAMTDVGLGVYQALLPPAECGDTPEYFVTVTDAACGLFQSDVFQPEVGDEVVVQFDDLEVASGWTVGAPGDDASTGVWTRVDPVGTAAQPEDDHTAGGTDCFVTGQGSPGGSLGDNDVDGGTTTLTSPAIDLSDGDARIDYWRWFSNDTGSGASSDVFVVQVGNGDGNWVTVETVGPTGVEASGGWFSHQFLVSDFVTPTDSVQLRFVASDLGTGSLVEAAVDDLRVVRVTCDVCQDSLGSAGPGTAVLSVCGPPLATGAVADLAVTGTPPGSVVWLGAAGAPNPVPLFGGTFLAWPPAVVVPLVANGAGEAGAPLTGGLPGGAATVILQAVYLDAAQIEGVGLTNALALDFLP